MELRLGPRPSRTEGGTVRRWVELQAIEVAWERPALSHYRPEQLEQRIGWSIQSEGQGRRLRRRFLAKNEATGYNRRSGRRANRADRFPEEPTTMRRPVFLATAALVFLTGGLSAVQPPLGGAGIQGKK